MWHQQDAHHQRTKKPLRVITPVGAFRLVDVCHQLISLSIVSLPKIEVKIRFAATAYVPVLLPSFGFFLVTFLVRQRILCLDVFSFGLIAFSTACRI